MKPITIGQDAAGRPIRITPEMRQRTHMHVIGGSGTGKSKFLESMIRQDIREGHGFCLIDWHGTLYNDILRYCAHLDVGLHNDFRSVVLVNPSKPDFITGFNPFVNPGADVSTQVSKRIDATIRPWGAMNTNETPTFARIARVLYTFMAESRQTLPNAALLLDFEQRQLREYARLQVSDGWVKSQWRSLQAVKTEKDWHNEVLSTDNRLARFIGSTSVRRFMGLTENNLDLIDIVDSGKILLVNLGASGFLDREAARVFASLFLLEFFDAAMLRANRSQTGNKPNHYLLYLDEFQQYITEDIAAMLDEVRKGGLHVVLAHQHLGHLSENPKLRKSIFTNARIRTVFGGLDYEDACTVGNEMFLPDLNTRQIKKAYYHTIHLYDEQTRLHHATSNSAATMAGTSKGTSRTSGSGDSSGSGSMSGSASSSSEATGGIELPLGVDDSEGWFSETNGESSFSSDSWSETSSSFSSETQSSSESRVHSQGHSKGETEVPVWVPIPKQELGSETEWSREEKLSRVAQTLKEQMQQHCFIKLDTEKTQPLKVPFVKEYCKSNETLVEYQRQIYDAQHAIPAVVVDQLLLESQAEFLAAASCVIDTSTEEHATATAAPVNQLRNKKTPIWDDARIDGEFANAEQLSAFIGQVSRRKRGPSPDIENHVKVATIVRRYGAQWANDDNLRDICNLLDRQSVPIPDTWLTRRPASRSWKRAFENYPEVVRKVVTYRCKVAETHDD